MDDLGIFGKRDNSGIFDIYNQTHTRGGEALLKEMFQNPLSDKEAINRRSQIIKHFAWQDMAFPLDAALLDMTEKYLLPRDEKTHQAPLAEKEVHQGVTAVIALIQSIREVIGSAAVTGNHAYAQEREGIGRLLADPGFAPVLKERAKEKISFTAVAAFDVLFRIGQHDKLRRLLAYIYFLDVYLSVAKVAIERKFVFPRATDKGGCILDLEGVYHPGLKQPVGNTILMDPGQNIIFLTGANMAGKSTFLRAVSTAMYLAHMGFPVAAASMEFSVMDGIFTTINLPDNLGIGASHFYTEVLRVKKVATELSRQKSLFIVFDELFRGTNVKDAQEATVAVTHAFAGKKTSMFIISSHIVEAGEKLGTRSNIGFLYLPTRMNGHQPEYTYNLEKGITDDRHGMIIINNEGILEILENGKKS